MERRGVLLLLGIGSLGVVWAPPGHAAVARALSVRELVTRSRFALVATTLSRESSWQTVGDSRRIVTTTRARVEELVTGAEPGTSELLFRTLGGQIGKIGQLVEGEADFVIGETALVFGRLVETELYGVTGMAQGHYPVAVEARGRVLQKGRSLPALLGAKGSAVERLTGATLAEAIDLVRAERK